MRRKSFAARVWSKLVLFDREQELLGPGDEVLAAVSGGPDSVCLAHYLAVRRRRLGFGLRLLHVRHGLRGRESQEDARSVARLGRRLGLEVLFARAPAAELARRRRAGLEEAARKARYAALVRAARRLGCGKVATGHQLDDQAETVLLNLLRGTRLAALGGIPPSRPLARGVKLIRPLLPIGREEVLAYLEVHGLPHRLDRSNLSKRHTRNRLRLEVLPLLAAVQPRAREHLAGIAAQVRTATAAGAGAPRRARGRRGGRPRRGPC